MSDVNPEDLSSKQQALSNILNVPQPSVEALMSMAVDNDINNKLFKKLEEKGDGNFYVVENPEYAIIDKINTFIYY